MAGKFGSFVSVGLYYHGCCYRRKLMNIYPVLIQVHSYRHTLPPTRLPDTITPNAAKEFVIGLDDNTRFLLLQELQSCGCSCRDTQELKGTEIPHKVTWPQLRAVFLFNGIPFIGFGFLDNALMIVAGEYIDAKICVVLGLSTMAAAAWGNLVSDIAGVGCAGYVETLAHKIGVTPVPLTPEQTVARSTRCAIALGRSLGLFIGCIIGMVPLLFYAGPKKKDAADSSQQGS